MIKIAEATIEENERKKTLNYPVIEEIRHNDNEDGLVIAKEQIGFQSIIVWPIRNEIYFQCPTCLAIVRSIYYELAKLSPNDEHQFNAMFIYRSGRRYHNSSYEYQRGLWDRVGRPIKKISCPNRDDEYREFNLPRKTLIEEVDKVPDYTTPIHERY